MQERQRAEEAALRAQLEEERNRQREVWANFVSSHLQADRKERIRLKKERKAALKMAKDQEQEAAAAAAHARTKKKQALAAPALSVAVRACSAGHSLATRAHHQSSS